MSTTIKHQAINTGNFTNFGQPKINKHYETNPVVHESGDDKSVVDFSKPSQDLPLSEIATEATQETVETANASELPQTDEQKRLARRDAFKHAADIEKRAMQMQKEAEATKSQLKQFQEFMNLAKNDPTMVAKALGMDPQDFLKRYQNQMFNIPNEPEKPKELSIEEKLSKYEEERKREKQELFEFKSREIKNNYMATKILPIIQAEAETFELLNMNGADQCASFIYDMMDSHYRETGEELNPKEVALEMEEQLSNEFEERIAQTKKLKKFNKHFRYDTDAPGEELGAPGQLEARTTAQDLQLGSNNSPQLQSDSSLNTRATQGPPSRVPLVAPQPQTVLGPAAQANAAQRQGNYWSKREQRLEKMSQIAKQVAIKGVDGR